MKRGFLFILFVCSLAVCNAQSIKDDVLTYTNALRNSNGKSDLIMRDDVSAIAQQHSLNMASGKTNFGHDGFEQREQQVIRFMPTLKAIAENVAYGPTTGKEVVEMWTNSKGHKKNMLGNYKYIGIGIATSSSGDIYYTEVFVN